MKLKKEPDILLDMFSFSKLETFAKCPRKAFYRYIVRQKTPPSLAMIKGRAVHGGQEHDNRERLKGRWPLLTEIRDKAVTQFEEEGGGEHRVDSFEEEHQIQLEKYWETGMRDALHPVKDTVEAFFEIDVDVTPDPQSEPQTKATVQGFVDKVAHDAKNDGELTVVDYKTVARPVSTKEADKSLQNALYMEASGACFARNVSFVKEGRQHANAKTTDPVEASKKKFEFLLTFLCDNITSFRKNVKSGDWPKCTPSCFWCSPGACDYYDNCYPATNKQLGKYIQVTEVRPVGTLEVPEWRKKKDAS
jgi:RecB family exonuclease